MKPTIKVGPSGKDSIAIAGSTYRKSVNHIRKTRYMKFSASGQTVWVGIAAFKDIQIPCRVCALKFKEEVIGYIVFDKSWPDPPPAPDCTVEKVQWP